MGGKEREKNFFQKTHVNREVKTMEKNRLEKVRKHVFYENTNIVTKKWGGGKTGGKNCQKTHEYGNQNLLKKNRLDKE